MRRLRILPLLITLSASYMNADGPVVTHFSPRSQGVNAAREMVGMEEYINKCCRDDFYGAFSVAAEYSQSFRAKKLAQALFGSDLNNCNGCGGNNLVISGSRVVNRGAQDWLADYFGLPTDFQSTISFRPNIKNVVVDFEFYLGADPWEQGSYFRVNMPLTHTRWNLHPCEVVNVPGVNAYPAGYFTANSVPRSQLLTSALSFLTGSVPTLDTVTTFHQLNNSTWSCERNKTRLADIELVFGRNLHCLGEDSHSVIGVSLRAEAPTGNKPKGELFFEPIVGNGGHWTLGLGLNGKHVFWCKEDGSSFTFYIDANIVHFFRSCQKRSFDLCGKQNSRYMLAEKMPPQNLEDNRINGSFGGTNPFAQITSTYQFALEFTPVANITARTVDVSVAVQGDIALKLAYDTGNRWVVDLGYNFWARSCEKIRVRNQCAQPDITQWALKGDAQVYGFDDTGASVFSGVPLGATESLSTIHAGTNISSSTTQTQATQNLNIDNPLNAFLSNDTELFSQKTTAGTLLANTSIQSILLKESDINLSGTSGSSHKIFAHLNYTGEPCEHWTPFVGLGASAEIGKTTCNNQTCCTTNASAPSFDRIGSCSRAALSQWAVWLKGGVAFN